MPPLDCPVWQRMLRQFLIGEGGMLSMVVLEPFQKPSLQDRWIRTGDSIYRAKLTPKLQYFPVAKP